MLGRIPVDTDVYTPYIQNVSERSGLLWELQARREVLAREVAELKAKITKDSELLRQKQLTLESVLELMRMEGGAAADGDETRHFMEVAFDHLLQNGPMHYTKLCSALLAKGVLIPGGKPEANLLAHIGRDARFERVRRGEYSVARRTRGRTNGERQE